MNQRIQKPTIDQAIALFQLTAQLSGTKWTKETYVGKGIETSLEVLAEKADQIWDYLNHYVKP
jgi:hypothetical protein